MMVNIKELPLPRIWKNDERPKRPVNVLAPKLGHNTDFSAAVASGQIFV